VLFKESRPICSQTNSIFQIRVHKRLAPGAVKYMRSDYASVHIVLYRGAGINKAYSRKRKIGLFRRDDGDRLALLVK
jgi:hypothetical protein